ncbi:type II secretion system protein [Trinickia sp. YCB016]
MRSGKARRARGAARTRERGIAYMGVLVMIAVLGFGIMEAASVWSTTLRRQQEAELLFVGGQYRDAIAHYYQSAEGSRYPESLDALVEDKRVPYTLRHLRRLYPDPLTGKTDWELVKSPEGGIMGVYSKAPGKPLKQGGFATENAEFADKSSYQDWRFVYVPQDPNANSSSTTSAPAE